MGKTEKIIKVYDSLFPENLVEGINHFALNSGLNIYEYKNNVTSADQTIYKPAISHTFLTEDNKMTEHCAFLLQPLYSLCSLKNIILHRAITARIFVSLPVNNLDFTYIHNDLPYDHFVCIYYINDSDGDTIFYNDQEEEIKRVTPKKGRVVFFDGTIKHTGSAPKEKTRAIINYNFLGNTQDIKK